MKRHKLRLKKHEIAKIKQSLFFSILPTSKVYIFKKILSSYFLGAGYDAEHHFQQYFSYIVVVNFIGGKIRGTWRKPPIFRKSLTNFIT